ncbi:MAG: hypothetical protein IPP19_04870 [Verrucomicrobia bacterium]|nr:hypothetical protein [Verrucomicrobiota bacterium]
MATLSDRVAKSAQPLRVIELITLLAIAGIIVAITLPRCSGPAPTPHNQPPPASAPQDHPN